MKLIDEVITIALIQLFTGSALICGIWGIDWITEGHGLHPVLAGVCISVFLLAPYFAAVMGRLSIARRRLEDHDETA
jgi:hypothetical protein